MRPRERRAGQLVRNDLFRARLDQIVDTDHPLAKLGWAIDWRLLSRSGSRRGLFRQGRTPLSDPQAHAVQSSPTRIFAQALDREPVLSAVLREEFFQHQLTFDRFVADALAPTDGRGTPCRAGSRKSLLGRHAGHRRGQACLPTFPPCIVDTTVQPKGCRRLSDRRQADRCSRHTTSAGSSNGLAASLARPSSWPLAILAAARGRSDPLARLPLEVHQNAPPLQTPRSSRATSQPRPGLVALTGSVAKPANASATRVR